MVTNEGENLVFIFSLPRSGSTLLSFLLGSHSKILCPPEPWFLLKIADLTRRCYIDSPFDDELATIGSKEFLDGNVFVEAARAYATTAYNHYLEESGKTIFVDKTPRYYHIIQKIDEMFPKAKKIWLKRNPLDIAVSYKKSWDMGVEIITGERFLSHSLDFSLGLFSLADYFMDISPQKYVFSYETLVKSPGKTLSDLCNFMHIKYEDSMLEAFDNAEIISKHKSASMGDTNIYETSKVHNQSIDRWINELSVAELNRIISLLGFDIFYQMGYVDVVERLLALNLNSPSEEKAAEYRNRIRLSSFDTFAMLNNQLKECNANIESLKADLALVSASLSWRITAPLRRASDMMRIFRRRK